jgi:hypothetical protein
MSRDEPVEGAELEEDPEVTAQRLGGGLAEHGEDELDLYLGEDEDDEDGEDEEPARGLAGLVRRHWWTAAVLAVMVGALAWGWCDTASIPTGVGSCWTQEDGNGDVTAVRCDDKKAVDRVHSEVSDSAECPAWGTGHLEDGESSYLCLVPVR